MSVSKDGAQSALDHSSNVPHSPDPIPFGTPSWLPAVKHDSGGAAGGGNYICREESS